MIIKRIIEDKLDKSSYRWSTTILNVYKDQNKTNQVECNLELKLQESKEANLQNSDYKMSSIVSKKESDIKSDSFFIVIQLF